MKKILSLGAVLTGILFLAGCGQPQAGQNQNPTSDLGAESQQPSAQVQIQPQSQPASSNATAGNTDSSNSSDASNTNSNANSNSSNTTTNNMGLKIETTQPGTGNQAVKNGDTVAVQYTGKLTDGTVFDATANHGGQPFSFTVGAGQVIKGWDEGLIGMKVGEKRTLTIPPSLGYGAAGAGDAIPPNATLIFDIQLVSIN